MKRSTLQFKARFNRAQDKLERKGYRMAVKALSQQYRAFVERSRTAFPETWVQLADNISEEPIKNFLRSFYRMHAPLALMQRKEISKEKADGDNIYLSIYEQHMLFFLEEHAGTNIKTITATSVDKIKGVIRNVLTESETEGLGIEEIRRKLEKSVGANLRGNARARARAIAQTEMIKASNEASKYAVDSTGLEYRKFWSSSHLPGTRASHSEAEQDSINRGGLRRDELHSNGLLYPGDPAGAVEEVVNCRCTELYEVI